MQFSARTVGLAAAAVTVLIWTSFIVIARASAAHTLLPLDIALMRILGASSVLLPWAWWRMRAERARGERVGSLWGLSPLPLRATVQAGFFGGLLYALLAYAGFFYAPAAHASVLMPGSLPLWTALLAMWLLHENIPTARALGLACIVLGDLLVGGMSLLKAFEGGEVWKGDLLFMTAACCWAGYSITVRRFALDAVREARVLEAKAKNVPVRELEAALDAGYGIYGGGDAKVKWATLLFDADAAQWVANEEWHPQQKSRHLADGRYELQVPYADATELSMDILRHGDSVQVLGDKALAAAIAALLQRAAAQYA